MPKPEQMFPVGTEEIKPLDEKKSLDARKYEGTRITSASTEEIPVYLTPRPDDSEDQLKRKEREDFELAKKNREYIANEK